MTGSCEHGNEEGNNNDTNISEGDDNADNYYERHDDEGEDYDDEEYAV